MGKLIIQGYSQILPSEEQTHSAFFTTYEISARASQFSLQTWFDLSTVNITLSRDSCLVIVGLANFAGWSYGTMRLLLDGNEIASLYFGQSTGPFIKILIATVNTSKGSHTVKLQARPSSGNYFWLSNANCIVKALTLI